MNDLLARTVLERLRTLVPVVLIGITASLAVSEPSGIPLTRGVIILNVFVIAALFGLFVAQRWDLVTQRWAHPAAALTALAPTVTTLGSLAGSGRTQLVILLVLEIMGASIQTSTRWMVGTVVGSAIAWAIVAHPLVGDQFGFQAGAVGGSIIVTIVFHRMLVHAICSAEAARLQERDVARKLEAELVERRRNEAERAQMREQLIHAQRLEAVGTLAAGLAHDMNNILGAIMSYADLVATSVDDPEVQRDANGIMDEAERGAVLTRSLLAFSRRGSYRKEPITLESVISSVTTILSRTLAKTVTVEHVVAAQPVIDGDVVQLGQVLVNLCINSADAIDGPGKVTIVRDVRTLDDETADRLALARGKEWAVLEVIDTGRGMDEETRRRIFEPFFTTKPVGKGTGLGLALVYGVVAAHGGALDVASAVGEGTRFTIYLPIVDAEPAPRRKPRAASSPLAKHHRVLVVDDEPAFRDTARRVLEKLGMEVTTAENGAIALDAFSRETFSLVILDMAMPVMGGAECFRALRRISDVPILISSGYALEQDTRALLVAGRAAFLEKPFHASQLATQVRALLGGDTAVA